MSINTMWPGKRLPVNLVSHTITTTGGPSRITYTNTGDVTTVGSNVSPAIGADEYLVAGAQGAGAGDQWDIYAEYVSGDPLTAGSPTNQWLSLATTRFWEQDESGTDRSTNLDIKLRKNTRQAVEYGPVRVTLTSIAPV